MVGLELKRPKNPAPSRFFGSSRLLSAPRLQANTASSSQSKLQQVSDFATTAFDVVHDSSDMLPPLKAVTGGALALANTYKRVESSKDNARALNEHCSDITAILEDAVPDLNSPSIPLNTLLQMDNLFQAHENACVESSRIQSQNKNESDLVKNQEQIGRSHQVFQTQVLLHTQLAVADAKDHIAKIDTATAQVQAELSELKRQNSDLHETIKIQGMLLMVSNVILFA